MAVRVRAGAVLKVRGAARRGRAGCLIGTGERATHLLTAGHLFEEGGAPEVYDGLGLRIGTLVCNLLDVDDWRQRADVAVVALEAPVVADPRGPLVRAGPRPQRGLLLGEEGAGPPVPIEQGRLATFSGPARPRPYRLGRVLLVRPRRSLPGDSGLPLVGEHPPHSVLGLLVGQLGAASAFQPLAPVEPVLTELLGGSPLVMG